MRLFLYSWMFVIHIRTWIVVGEDLQPFPDVEAGINELVWTLQENFQVTDKIIENSLNLVKLSEVGFSNIEVQSNAQYIYSMVLRRSPQFPQHHLLSARTALRKAIILNPNKIEWHEELASFLSVVNEINDDNIDETDGGANSDTFNSMLSSCELFMLSKMNEKTDLSSLILKDLISMLIELSHRLLSSPISQNLIQKEAIVASLMLALRFSSTAFRPLQFKIIKLLSSILPNKAASLFEDFIDQTHSESVVELLWAGYSQLQPSYASVLDSKSSVAKFEKYTNLAAMRGVRYDSYVDLLSELPMIPHWRLGFSGSTGSQLISSLQAWNHAIRSLRSSLGSDHNSPSSSSSSSSMGPRIEQKPNRTDRIVIGFVSSWFCNSAVGRLILGLVEHLDRLSFEVKLFHLVGLSGQVNRDDYFTPLFKQVSDFYELVYMNSGHLEGAADTLRAGRCDVLIYTDIGMEPSSYYLASHRIAPLQLVFWGHPFTSGIIDTVDYYLLPRGAEYEPTHLHDALSASDRYSEQLVRLDTLGSPYSLLEDQLGEVPWFESFQIRTMTLTSLVQSHVLTFLNGSKIPINHHAITSATLYSALQHCGKQHPYFDDYLLQILKSDQNAVLLIRHCGPMNDSAADRFSDFTGGVPENTPTSSFSSRLGSQVAAELVERVLEIHEQLPLGTLIRLIGAAHVALEPFPFPASITSLDAFMAGTPVVAHGGELFNQGIAQLTAMLYRVTDRNHNDYCCIANNQKEYITLAIKLANNHHQLRDFARNELMELRMMLFDHYQSLEEWSTFLKIAMKTHSFSFQKGNNNHVKLKTKEVKDKEEVGCDENNEKNFKNQMFQINNFLSILLNQKQFIKKINPTFINDLSFDLNKISNKLFMFTFHWLDCPNDQKNQNDIHPQWFYQKIPNSLRFACTTIKQSLEKQMSENHDELAMIFQELSGNFLWMVQEIVKIDFSELNNIQKEEEEEENKNNFIQYNKWYNISTEDIIKTVLKELFETNQVTPLPTSSRMLHKDIDNLAALSAMFSYAALQLRPNLINAAAFGAPALARLGAYDAAAQLYETAAELKRPYFGDKISAATSSQMRNDDWLRIAAIDPLNAACSQTLEMVHPSTAFDLGPEDGAEDRQWRPFRRIQFGGYNSAYLRHLSNQFEHLLELNILPSYQVQVVQELLQLAHFLDLNLRNGQKRHLSDESLPFGSEHVDLPSPTQVTDMSFNKDDVDGEEEDDKGNRVDVQQLMFSSSFVRTLAVFGRTVYIRPTPSLKEGALATHLMTPCEGCRELGQTQAASFESDGFALVDNVLSPKALSELREFCEQSTIFHKTYIQGYVGAFLGDGFGASGLLHQIAAEMKIAFSHILKHRHLVQAWAYKYDEEHHRGIDPHSDTGQVSVNLWMTPNEANLDPTTAGLIIWPELPPEEWSFGQSNHDTAAIKTHLSSKKKHNKKEGDEEEEGEGAIGLEEPLSLEEYANSPEKGTRSVRIPYRENRCLLFKSRLFHQTDTINFKTGFKNRRINVTFLFQ